jgi:hypothetical protein
MNEISQDIVGVGPVDLEALDGCHVPRISIVAFCETAGRRRHHRGCRRRPAHVARQRSMCGSAASRGPSSSIARRRRPISSSWRAGPQRRSPERRSKASPRCAIPNQGRGHRRVQRRHAVSRAPRPRHRRLSGRAGQRARGHRGHRPGVPRQRPKKLGKTCAFIGAKGGVGASTVAHNVAWALAGELASNVILADMDLPFGTAGLDFNIDAEQGIAEAIGDSGRLDELLLDRLLVKLQRPSEPARGPGRPRQGLRLRRNGLRADAGDCPGPCPQCRPRHAACVDRMGTAHADSADEVVIVAEPDLANLRNAKSLVEL